jgi:hypothetical protein
MDVVTMQNICLYIALLKRDLANQYSELYIYLFN